MENTCGWSSGGSRCGPAPPEDYEHTWRAYFDLEEDYAPKREALAAMSPALAEAAAFAPGIRILRQEPWEALCSFIISQNNHIPRIKGIIERLCRLLGAELPGTGWHAFPTAGAWPPAPWRIWRLCGRGSGPNTCWTPPGRWPLARWIWPGGRRPRGGGPWGAANHLRRGAQGGGVRFAVRLPQNGCFPLDLWMKRAMATPAAGARAGGIWGRTRAWPSSTCSTTAACTRSCLRKRRRTRQPTGGERMLGFYI